MPDQTPKSIDLYAIEAQARLAGAARPAGVDEAGRGPLAGPVVVAAVVLPPGWRLPGLNDSKQVRPAVRERLAEILRQQAGVSYAIIEVGVAEIDTLNILHATWAGMRRALLALQPMADLALVDGLPVPGLPLPSQALVKGDGRCAAIAAASILAKVHRDCLMVAADSQYPGYDFGRHKGYGTAAHLAALRRLGPCPIHRRSFAPVSQAELAL
jgi:ribonuclease HII